MQTVLERASSLVEDPWHLGDSGTSEQTRSAVVIVSDDALAEEKVTSEKNEKIEKQSRRWGYAKKNKEILLDAGSSKMQAFKIFETKFEDQIIEHLKPVYLVIFTDLMQHAK